MYIMIIARATYNNAARHNIGNICMKTFYDCFLRMISERMMRYRFGTKFLSTGKCYLLKKYVNMI